MKKEMGKDVVYGPAFSVREMPNMPSACIKDSGSRYNSVTSMATYVDLRREQAWCHLKYGNTMVRSIEREIQVPRPGRQTY